MNTANISDNFFLDMSMDALDVMGEIQLDISNSDVFRERLNRRGEVISDAEEAMLLSDLMKTIEPIPIPQNENGCNGCYGAESPTRKCCNSCEDVAQSYREKGWSFSAGGNIAQVID